MLWYSILVTVATWVAIVPLATADFQLFTYYDPDTIQTTYNLTSSCLNAL